MREQLAFAFGLDLEGRRGGAPPPSAGECVREQVAAPDVASVVSVSGGSPLARGGNAGRRAVQRETRKEAREDWTPERVRSYLAGLGVDPAAVVVGPDMLKLLPYGGVRRVEWAEEHREACFPVRFLPRWRWEPYFVTAPFDHDGIGMLRPWVALGREPSGLRPYWLVGRCAEPWFMELGRPMLPACFVIGPECLCAEPRPVPAAVRQAVENALVLEEVLEVLRGRPVWLGMYTAGAVGHVVSRPFVLRDFEVDGRVPAGLGADGEGRVRVVGDSGFGFELGAARDFRVFPGYILIDSWVPGRGYGNSVSLHWGRD